MRKLLLSLSLFFCLAASAQTVETVDTVVGGYNMKITRPINYNGIDPHIVIFFFTGQGQTGTNPDWLDDYGPHREIAVTGWDAKITLGNGVHQLIIVTVQPTSNYARPWSVMPKLIPIANMYNAQAVHYTGFSMGGWVSNILATYKPATNDYSYYTFPQSIVNVQGVKAADTYGSTLGFPQRYGNWAKTYGGYFLGFEQSNDNRDLDIVADNVNDSIADHGRFLFTTFGTGAHGQGVHEIYSHDSIHWTTAHHEVIAGTGAMPSNGIADGQSIYQWMARTGDTSKTTTSPTELIISAGNDSTVAYSMSGTTPDFPLRGRAIQGTPVTVAWVQTAGPLGASIDDANTLTPTITDVTIAGTYTFQLIAIDGSAQRDTAYVNVWVRNYMEKNKSETGPGMRFVVGDVPIFPYVTNTYINMPYINRDGIFGRPLTGRDTIELTENPNDPNGQWDWAEFGDFGGNENDPVVIMPRTRFRVKGNQGIDVGTRDSNWVCYAKFDGLANRLTTGEVYGFQFVSSSGTTANHNAIGVTARLIHHTEFNGFYIENAGVGFFSKINSDSTYPWLIYDNVRLRANSFHDIYLKRINGEGFYIGHTDITGTNQSGNNGRTVIGDSCLFYRIIIDSCYWDGLQTSNLGYGSIIHDAVAYRTGTGDIGGQQFSIFGGGNMQITMYNIAVSNGTGPLGILGKGACLLYNVSIDSVYTAVGSEDGVYVNHNTGGSLLPYDSLTLETYNAGIRNVQGRFINYTNGSGAMKTTGSSIHDNHFTTPGTAIAPGPATTSNNITGAFDYDTHFEEMQAYRVLQFVKDNPGVVTSFYDFDSSFVAADAGPNRNITLPTDHTTLVGSGTAVPGAITGYSWAQTFGPASEIVSPTSGTTQVNYTVAGTYVYTLTVTDDQGRTALDEVTVIVNPALTPGAAPRIRHSKVLTNH